APEIPVPVNAGTPARQYANGRDAVVPRSSAAILVDLTWALDPGQIGYVHPDLLRRAAKPGVDVNDDALIDRCRSERLSAAGGDGQPDRDRRDAARRPHASSLHQPRAGGARP